jgi:hypothetical protein
MLYFIKQTAAPLLALENISIALGIVRGVCSARQ